MIFGPKLESILEILSAAVFFTLYFFAPFVAIFAFVYLFFTPWWWINFVYLSWHYWDYDKCEKGSRYSARFLSCKLWDYARKYFPARFIPTPGFELDPAKNYLFCCFPHGLVPIGPCLTVITRVSPFAKLFPNFSVNATTLDIPFMIPFYREYLLFWGVVSCNKKSINYILSKPEGGHIVILWPGGAEEALHSEEYTFVIKNRKGFVKMALENGASLVPVITFGELDLFMQLKSEWLKKFQRFVKKVLGFAPVVFYGRGFFQNVFGFIPRKRPLTTVVGPPIDVSKVVNPTNEQVDDLHLKFMQQLLKLFEDHKHDYLQNAKDIDLSLI